MSLFNWGAGNFANLPRIVADNYGSRVIGIEHPEKLADLALAIEYKGQIYGDLLMGYQNVIDAGAEILFLDYVTDMPSGFADKVIVIAPNPLGAGPLANRFETASAAAKIAKPGGSIYIVTEHATFANDMATVLSNKLGISISPRKVHRQVIPYVSEYLDNASYSFVIETYVP